MDRARGAQQRRLRRVALGFLLLSVRGGVSQAADPARRSATAPVLVSAAISLRAALEQAAARWHATGGGKVELNTGASGALLAQIEGGAVSDLLISASPDELDRLEKSALLDAASRTTLASNRLVVVLPGTTGAIARLDELADPRFARIAIGNPGTVPAGRYAEQALRAAGAWDRLGGRLVRAENVRQALDWLVRGECDAALVYRTDAPLAAANGHVAFELPTEMHTPLLYQGAVLAQAHNAVAARAFLGFLASPEGRAILTQHGFLPPPVP